MAEYVNRENACMMFNRFFSMCETEEQKTMVLDMKQACLELPTADVVEVVRCKDCIKRNTPDCAIWNHCVICGDQWTLNVKNDFYCARGAKMNEEKKAGVDNG